MYSYSSSLSAFSLASCLATQQHSSASAIALLATALSIAAWTAFGMTFSVYLYSLKGWILTGCSTSFGLTLLF
jgi:hypothetical protein